MNVEVTRIVVADQHFLYLPLYFAHHKKYFGLLPKSCRIEIVRSAKFTDASAYEMLMDQDQPAHHGMDVAVCDPAAVLFRTQPNTHPVVLAGLLTNSAFWVVDHKANKGAHLESLSTFNGVIAFKKGTTSFGIASRIFQNPEAIQCVNPKEELHTLVDSGVGTIALSPDILSIQKLLETRGQSFGIEMALADTPEYNGMLVTALLTRRDVLETKAELIQALLKAVQISLDLVRQSTEEVIQYACDRFGEQRHTVERALKEAERTTVYPPEIKVQQPHWMKLAETAYSSVGHQFDSAARDKALSYYRSAVQPYENWASQAVKTVKSNPTLKDPPLTKWQKAAPWAVVLVPTLATIAVCLGYVMLTSATTPWYCWAAVVLALAVSIWGARSAKIQPWSLAGSTFWLPMLASFVGVLALGDLASANAFVTPLLHLSSDVLTIASVGAPILATWIAEAKSIDSKRKK
jgi:hypothetical protein